ncbi:RNA-binding protein [Bosea sp. TWI1241]|uniref:RNA-binding protein n=1 Tax=Bosea sp. TWI1241 TaxID=3148904 RepID=UPI0032094B2D
MSRRAEKEGQERTCAVTRQACPPEALLRFVAGPDGVLVPDIRRKLPGRGVWVGLSAATVAEGVRRKAFERSLKAKVTVPAGLPEQVDTLLARDAVQALAMANKAGLVVAGFAKVEASIASGRAAAVLMASDGADDGRRKMGQVLRRASAETGRTVPVVAIFASAELELALGREHVIHAALAPGPATEGFLARWRRLVRYRTGDAGTTPFTDPVDSEARDHEKTERAGPIADD